MARRPLPRILSSGSASITRSREMARTAADSATDVLHPLITITRGLRLLATAGRQKWAATPKDRRGPKLFLVAACVLVVALAPYGPLLALISVMGAAAWAGRERTAARPVIITKVMSFDLGSSPRRTRSWYISTSPDSVAPPFWNRLWM